MRSTIQSGCTPAGPATSALVRTVGGTYPPAPSTPMAISSISSTPEQFEMRLGDPPLFIYHTPNGLSPARRGVLSARRNRHDRTSACTPLVVSSINI